MKKLLFQAIACCAVLMPVSNAVAATPGGYPSGTKFTLKLKEKITSKAVGTKITKNVAVPAGVPNLKVGEVVTFTIGDKGQISFSSKDKKTKVTVPFSAKTSSTFSNSYLIIPKPSTDMKATNMLLSKDNTTKKPANINYLYVNTKRTGFTATTITVDYNFEVN